MKSGSVVVVETPRGEILMGVLAKRNDWAGELSLTGVYRSPRMGITEAATIPPQAEGDKVPQTPELILKSWAAIAVVAPIVEEWYNRGSHITGLYPRG